LPRIGRLLSGASSAYSYLPTSVGRFPAPLEMLATLESVGFIDARWTPYTLGVAGLYTAHRP
jgi:demethylmenaquinone methyltransferase / 2-methoxy-6-polyprenyl-1,4-benzoquinol methylase